MSLTFKINHNLTATQPLASFSIDLYYLLCLTLTDFFSRSFQVKLEPLIKLCLLFFSPFRAKVMIPFMAIFPGVLACNYFFLLSYNLAFRILSLSWWLRQ